LRVSWEDIPQLGRPWEGAGFPSFAVTCRLDSASASNISVLAGYGKRVCRNLPRFSTTFPEKTSGDRGKITSHGNIEQGLCVVSDVAIPPGAVDSIEGKRCNDVCDALDRGRIERNVVRIAVHEAHRAAVHRDHRNVPRQQ